MTHLLLMVLLGLGLLVGLFLVGLVMRYLAPVTAWLEKLTTAKLF